MMDGRGDSGTGNDVENLDCVLRSRSDLCGITGDVDCIEIFSMICNLERDSVRICVPDDDLVP